LVEGWTNPGTIRVAGELLAGRRGTGGAVARLLAEYPEPFWRMGGVSAAARDGRLPNSFGLLARAR
jgi:hypothetical protein